MCMGERVHGIHEALSALGPSGGLGLSEAHPAGTGGAQERLRQPATSGNGDGSGVWHPNSSGSGGKRGSGGMGGHRQLPRGTIDNALHTAQLQQQQQQPECLAAAKRLLGKVLEVCGTMRMLAVFKPNTMLATISLNLGG